MVMMLAKWEYQMLSHRYETKQIVRFKLAEWLRYMHFSIVIKLSPWWYKKSNETKLKSLATKMAVL